MAQNTAQSDTKNHLSRKLMIIMNKMIISRTIKCHLTNEY